MVVVKVVDTAQDLSALCPDSQKRPLKRELELPSMLPEHTQISGILF